MSELVEPLGPSICCSSHSDKVTDTNDDLRRQIRFPLKGSSRNFVSSLGPYSSSLLTSTFQNLIAPSFLPDDEKYMYVRREL